MLVTSELTTGSKCSALEDEEVGLSSLALSPPIAPLSDETPPTDSSSGFCGVSLTSSDDEMVAVSSTKEYSLAITERAKVAMATTDSVYTSQGKQSHTIKFLKVDHRVVNTMIYMYICLPSPTDKVESLILEYNYV